MFWLLYIDTLSPSCTTIKYADDVTLIPSSSSEKTEQLQQAIDETTEWCAENNMIANPTKSVSMTFSNVHNSQNIKLHRFSMSGDVIGNETSTKFLGVVIDNNLTFKQHVDHLVKKTRPIIYTLIDLKRSGMPISALKHFYIACIRPILLYASPSWYSMLSQQLRMRILCVENLVLKVLDPCSLDYNDRTLRYNKCLISSTRRAKSTCVI